ncbi:MAG: hypothetical protein N3D73_03035, partial [Candidatus Diapherotrites archaeon]|nr:hypothetical protein [Candidatus Diapherotrites archaeon]
DVYKRQVLDWLKNLSCGYCSSCSEQYPLPIYSNAFPDNTKAFCFKNIYMDLNCQPHQLDFFIEVRPAKNYHDDYADYIEFLQNICLSFVKEYEKRINYARECSELSQMVISGNYLIQQQCKTDIKTKATRKIKV